MRQLLEQLSCFARCCRATRSLGRCCADVTFLKVRDRLRKVRVVTKEIRPTGVRKVPYMNAPRMIARTTTGGCRDVTCSGAKGLTGDATDAFLGRVCVPLRSALGSSRNQAGSSCRGKTRQCSGNNP
eukprot:scaffold7427_cov74-Phaeocystis_antarctica.AAC.2